MARTPNKRRCLESALLLRPLNSRLTGTKMQYALLRRAEYKISENWWSPAALSNDENKPDETTYLDVSFTPQSQLTSVIINSMKGKEKLTVLFLLRSAETRYYTQILNKDGSSIFEVYSGSKIPLPEDIFALNLGVFLVNPDYSNKYQVIVNGCEEDGEILEYLKS